MLVLPLTGFIVYCCCCFSLLAFDFLWFERFLLHVGLLAFRAIGCYVCGLYDWMFTGYDDVLLCLI